MSSFEFWHLIALPMNALFVDNRWALAFLSTENISLRANERIRMVRIP
jgi:hypothetical protein